MNKPRIYKLLHGWDLWIVKQDALEEPFVTWNDALAFALKLCNVNTTPSCAENAVKVGEF